jgi:hypothetical protein
VTGTNLAARLIDVGFDDPHSVGESAQHGPRDLFGLADVLSQVLGRLRRLIGRHQ